MGGWLTRSVVAGVAAVMLFAVPGCKKSGGASGKPLVVASIFPVYDLTRRVAGDAVRVELLLPPGRGVHDYQPTTKDARRVSGAKLAFLVGLELDEWTAKVVESAGGDTKIVELGERVERKRFDTKRIGGEGHDDHKGEKGHDEHEDEKGHDEHEDEKGHDEHEDEKGHDDHEDEKGHDDHEDEKGHDEHEDHAKGGSGAPEVDEHEAHQHHDGDDPHVWLSVPIAMAMVDVITAELSTAWPAHKQTFEANATALKKELQALHSEITEATAAFAHKELVTFHGSFGYFAAQYGLKIVAVIEPFPGKEPSAAYLKEVLATVSKSDVKALYTEPQLAARPAEVLAKEAGLSLHVLDPVGGLEGRDSYAAMMRFNVQALGKSLK